MNKKIILLLLFFFLQENAYGLKLRIKYASHVRPLVLEYEHGIIDLSSMKKDTEFGSSFMKHGKFVLEGDMLHVHIYDYRCMNLKPDNLVELEISYKITELKLKKQDLLKYKGFMSELKKKNERSSYTVKDFDSFYSWRGIGLDSRISNPEYSKVRKVTVKTGDLKFDDKKFSLSISKKYGNYCTTKFKFD